MIELACVGCGRVIWWGRDTTLALACACGAMAPFLENAQSQRIRFPGSILKLGLHRTPSRGGFHWQYYLGYSDHESEIKTKVLEGLVKLGGTDQRDCERDDCQKAYQIGLARWQEFLERQVIDGQR